MATVRSPLNLEILLDDLAFPAEKAAILNSADENGASDDAMTSLRGLPDQRYTSMVDVNTALGKIARQPGNGNLWASADVKETSKTRR